MADVVRLVELTNFAKKALTLAQGDCAKANVTVLASNEHRENIIKQVPRLAFLDKELNRQIEILNQIMFQVMEHNDAVFHQYETLETVNIPRVYDDLENSFNLLKERKVAKELVVECRALLRRTAAAAAASSASPMSTAVASAVAALAPQPATSPAHSPSTPEEMTLFEFVDEDSISQLKLRTAREMTASKELYNQSHSTCIQLNDRIDEISEALGDFSLEEENLDAAVVQTEANLHEQQVIAEKMANTLMELAQFYEQCVAMLKRLQEAPGSKQGREFSAIEATATSVPTTMDTLDANLQRLGHLGMEIALKTERYEQEISKRNDVFHMLDELTSPLREGLAEVKASEVILQARVEAAKQNLAEFNDLVTWYDMFYDAYDRFIVELNRRNSAAKQYDEVVEKFRAALFDLQDDERQRSEKFLVSFGQYLPPALHVFLRDAIPEGEIVLKPRSHQQHELPQSLQARSIGLSAETLAEAVENVTRRTHEESQLLSS